MTAGACNCLGSSNHMGSPPPRAAGTVTDRNLSPVVYQPGRGADTGIGDPTSRTALDTRRTAALHCPPGPTPRACFTDGADMRLVHLTASPFFGGPERQMLGLADALPPGYDTTFVSFAE